MPANGQSRADANRATKEKEAKWYVYHLIDPTNDEVFYVGKGTGDRMLSHEREAKTGKCSSKVERIRSILDAGERVKRQKVAVFWDEAAAYALEAEQINTLPGLTNIVKNPQKPKKAYFTFYETVLKIASRDGDKKDLARKLSAFRERVVWRRDNNHPTQEYADFYVQLFNCGARGLEKWR